MRVICALNYYLLTCLCRHRKFRKRSSWFTMSAITHWIWYAQKSESLMTNDETQPMYHQQITNKRFSCTAA